MCVCVHVCVRVLVCCLVWACSEYDRVRRARGFVGSCARSCRVLV